jgi:NAD(P)-dependent dehydrogenase (short-subunit alcohol dehydrogenase family)
MGEFNEKVVLITGAAGVIGREASKRFKEEGALLVLIDNDSRSLENLKTYITEDEDTLFIEADCTDETQVQNYTRKAVELFGGIDIFVHCVGFPSKAGLIPSLEIQDFEEVFNTNILAALYNYKNIYPVMEKQSSGSILFIGAISSLRATEQLSCNVSANHALLGFMKSASLEAALTGVRVNAIIPTPVDGTTSNQTNGLGISNESPIGRHVTSKEIAESILFYSSTRASYINGNIHLIDGGYMVK